MKKLLILSLHFLQTTQSYSQEKKAVFKYSPQKSNLENFNAAEKSTTVETKNNSSLKFFTGTRKFCDGLDTWYYLVTITNSSIVLKSFPDTKNDYYKEKSKPKDIIKGIIKDGEIITDDPPEYLINRFKHEGDFLYEVNIEGEYNKYKECK